MCFRYIELLFIEHYKINSFLLFLITSLFLFLYSLYVSLCFKKKNNSNSSTKSIEMKKKLINSFELSQIVLE